MEERKTKAFDYNWNQATIKNLVKHNCYLEFGEHADLRAVCVTEEDRESNTRDWNELTFIVPTKWLQEYCEKEFDEPDLDYFLQEKYTSDESEVIFTAALQQRQIVMVDFL